MRNGRELQLCVKYQDLKKFKFPYIGQPKINGDRGSIGIEPATTGIGMFATQETKTIVRSRENHIYHLPHLSSNQFLNKLLEDLEFDLDGELYIPGKSISQIKTHLPLITHSGKIQEVQNNPEEVQYWIFDWLGFDTSSSNRMNRLNHLIPTTHIEDLMLNKNPIVRVPYLHIENLNELEQYTNYCIELGFEGAVYRPINTCYMSGKRMASMFKHKKKDDTECIIIDIIPKDKEPETGKFVLKNDVNDETFICNPEGTYAERKEYLDNKHNYIGKLARVSFYERSGRTAVPFHANVIGIF